MKTRLRHLWLALATLPGLLRDGRQRRLFAEMRALSRRLPQLMQQPLPDAMQALGNGSAPVDQAEDDVRRPADLAALLARRSPVGYCLRRSLLRYHFLQRAGLPLGVVFGARLRSSTRRQEGRALQRVPPEQSGIAGHAWVTLDGAPHHEPDENWRSFHVIYSWPQGE